MMTVLGCIVDSHTPWLVLLAVLIGCAGSWVAIRLFLRAARTAGVQRLGWNV